MGSEADFTNKAQKWLNLARWAASGANAQPWSITYEEANNSIAFHLCVDAEYAKHPSVMDVNGSASVLALGCLTENLKAVARADGYEIARVRFIEGVDLWKSSAVVTFNKTQESDRSFSAELLVRRRADRTPFLKKEIPPVFRDRLRLIAKTFDGLLLAETRPSNKEVINSLAKLEKIRWKNKKYLESLLEEISFSDETSPRQDGIPASQLGVNKMDQSLLKTMKRHPFLLRFMNKIMYPIPVMKSRSLLKSCDRIYFLEAKENSFESFFNFGRCYQLLWQEATAMGLAFQPVGLPLIALEHWLNPNSNILNRNEKNIIEQVTEIVGNASFLDLRKLVIGFRLGWPKNQVAKSPRKNIQAKPEAGLLTAAAAANEKSLLP